MVLPYSQLEDFLIIKIFLVELLLHIVQYFILMYVSDKNNLYNDLLSSSFGFWDFSNLNSASSINNADLIMMLIMQICQRETVKSSLLLNRWKISI